MPEFRCWCPDCLSRWWRKASAPPTHCPFCFSQEIDTNVGNDPGVEPPKDAA